MLRLMLSALHRLKIEADLIIIPPDGDLSAHLTPLVPGVIDLAPLGAVIVAAVVIETKIAIIVISQAIMPRNAPRALCVSIAGLRTINLGIAPRADLKTNINADHTHSVLNTR